MATIPYFPVFAADLLIDDDLFNLDPKTEGLLLRMWCLCWVDGYAPSDPELLSLKVRRKLGYVRNSLPQVLPFFVEDERGNLISKRIEAERAKAAGKSEKCRDAINARWAKRNKVGNTSVSSDVSTEPIPSLSLSVSVKEVPPTPRGGKRRRSRVEILEPFGPEVCRVVNTLLDEWRTKDPEDGRTITASAELTGEAVDSILKSQPNVTSDVLIQAGRDYLTSSRQRYKAPQYFFGVAGPWVAFVKAILTSQPVELPHAI